MKKIILTLLLLISCVSFADSDFGLIKESELIAVGVKKENIKKAKDLISSVENSYKLKVLERKKLEIEVNKLIVSDPSVNLKQIDELFDKIAIIDADIMKERIRSQIEMKKYITNDQYNKARDLANKRLQGTK